MEDNNYIEFKDWSNVEKFGDLSYSDYLYFRKEYRKLKIKGTRILEIGFGNGSFLTFCKNKNLDVTGTEQNELLNTAAIEKGFTIIRNDQLDEFFDSKLTFNAIFLFDVIEHIKFEDMILFFSRLRSILRKDGIIFCRFPNGDSSLSMAYYNGDHTHKSYIGYSKIKYLAKMIDMDFETRSQSKVLINYKRPIYSTYNIITEPIRYIIKKIYKFLYHPTDQVVVLEKNLICVLNKR